MSSKRYVVCATGVSTIQEKELRALVVKLKAKFSVDLTSSVTHLIVVKAGTKKHEMAISHNIPCVTYAWILDSVASGALLNSVTNYSVPPFLGLVLSITGVETGRSEMIASIERHGGTYSPELKHGYCTHLIAAVPRGGKYEHAKQWSSVRVASPAWVAACIDKQVWLQERDFPVLQPIIEAQVPSATHVQPPLTDTTPVSSEQHIPAVLRRLRRISQEELDDISDCDVFCNDTYYINGFNDEDTYKLVQILSIGGGVRHQMLSEKVTRVLLGPDASATLREAVKAHPRGAVAIVLEYFLKQIGVVVT